MSNARRRVAEHFERQFPPQGPSLFHGRNNTAPDVTAAQLNGGLELEWQWDANSGDFRLHRTQPAANWYSRMPEGRVLRPFVHVVRPHGCVVDVLVCRERRRTVERSVPVYRTRVDC